MKKKTLTAAIALVLIVALAVGATYAYLTGEKGRRAVERICASGDVVHH